MDGNARKSRWLQDSRPGEAFEPDASAMDSPGVERLRGMHPLRPGRPAAGQVTVMESVHARSRPDRGTVVGMQEAYNQRDLARMSLHGRMLVQCRPRTTLAGETDGV
jgi:acyl dehydratase